jgi:hypothetical protein
MRLFLDGTDNFLKVNRGAPNGLCPLSSSLEKQWPSLKGILHPTQMTTTQCAICPNLIAWGDLQFHLLSHFPTLHDSLLERSPSDPTDRSKAPKPEICPVCGRSFPNGPALETHLQRHCQQGVKTLPTQDCIVCGAMVDLEDVSQHFLDHARPLAGTRVSPPPAKATPPPQATSRAVGTTVPPKATALSSQGNPNSSGTEEEVLVCDICKKRVPLSKFDMHLSNHESSKAMILCDICLEDHPVHEYYTFPCDHRVCRKETLRHIRQCLSQKIFVGCPTCRNRMTSADLEPFLTEAERKEHLPWYRRDELEAELSNGAYAICPTPNCAYRVALTAEQAKQAYGFDCPKCRQSFCTLCRVQPYHYRTRCDEAASVKANWLGISGSLVNGQALEDRRQQKAAYEILRQDELLKASKMVLCPNCTRVIEHIGGCSSMVCGRNTDDYTNQQSGCGFRFSLTQAKRYEARLPAVPEASGIVKEIEKLTTRHSEHQQCDQCHRSIIGARFECLNCAAETNFCSECLGKAVSTHPKGHSFHLRR